MTQTSAIEGELFTIRDFIRYGVSRFSAAGLDFGHGTCTAFDEAVFIVLEALHLPIDQIDPYWDARLTLAERKKLAELIDMRVTTRKPAPYLLNKAYIQGFPFYVDQRVIVPRSFIAEILCDGDCFSPIENPDDIGSILDLCTGSGCLAILAANLFPNAVIDAVDLSPDALDVARKNISDYGMNERITVFEGDLFAPLGNRTYDLIITNPPYVASAEMAVLPDEYRHEPSMALAGGKDGLDLVRKILRGAPEYLNENGGMLCEIGTGRMDLETSFPGLDFLWLDTVESSGEVFWITKETPGFA
jgi:ribosomal protein L3 glutamine methyltransferase